MSREKELLAELEKVKAQLALLQQAKASEGSAIALNQSKAVATGGTLIEGNVYIGPKTDDPTEALRIYRQVLLQNTAYLTLRGLDKGAADPTQGQKPVGLVNVYIDLDTTTQDAEPPTKNTAQTSEIVIKAKPIPLSALNAIIVKRQMVLLGDPGSGKSTFVRYLTHCLAAHHLEPDAGWLEQLPNWPSHETIILPIPIILRDFAQAYKTALPEQAEVSHLWQFLTTRLTAQNLDFALSPLRQMLEKGQTLVLLDGLDEIPTLPQRRFVRDAVRAFIQRYPLNRYLLTCRVLSYQPPDLPDQPDLRLPELPDIKLAPFDEEKIRHFIEAWYQELARLGTISSEDAPGLITKLTKAVRRPELWRLAPNPMLLTVMAVVHADRGRLPDARALLYEEIIDILLWRWEENKQGGQTDIPRLRQLLFEAGRSEVDLKRVLWELAYEAHTGVSGQDESLADIGELRLLKALAALKNQDTNWAREMVDAMKLRAGLLIERAPEVFTFPHRTFQEYLAGSRLASQANFAEKAASLIEVTGPWWEVILLATGKLVHLLGDLDKPLALVGELCPARIDETRAGWKKVWLAGDVLAEIGIQRVQDRALGRDLLAQVQQSLVALLERNALTPQERAFAGDTLALLGDPRFDPDAWYLPKEDLLGFVNIPAGPFIMGSDSEQDRNAQKDEQPHVTLELPTYWLARYPVTVAQFRAFADDSGYDFDNWQRNTIPNHPVVSVTWYDALAYCQWLNSKLKVIARRRKSDAGFPSHSCLLWEGLANSKLRVTLPSEAEWEKAARGPAPSLIYPWGDEFFFDRANTSETHLNTTSTVGCFPLGASYYKMLDLSGNVWEWTRTIFGKRDSKASEEVDLFTYPYQGSDGRENLDADDDYSRVLRGGSFINYPLNTRCAARLRNTPNLRNRHYGFRVVVSLAS